MDTNQRTATLLKLNAYGGRWHVRRDYYPSAMDRPTRDPIVYTGQTKGACKEFCRRHNIQIREKQSLLQSSTTGDGK